MRIKLATRKSPHDLLKTTFKNIIQSTIGNLHFKVTSNVALDVTLNPSLEIQVSYNEVDHHFRTDKVNL